MVFICSVGVIENNHLGDMRWFKFSSFTNCLGPNKVTSDVLHPSLWGLNPLRQVASLVRIYSLVLLVQCKQTKFYGANTERSWSCGLIVPWQRNMAAFVLLYLLIYFQKFQFSKHFMVSWKTIMSIYIFPLIYNITCKPKANIDESLKVHGLNVFLKFFCVTLS